MDKIYVVYGSDACDMTMALLKRAEVAARILRKLEKKRISPDKAWIRLKPNLVVAKSADQGATTHPGVLEGVIRYLQEHGFSNIEVIESSWIGERTERSFAAAGYGAVLDRYGVRFFDVKRDKMRMVKTSSGPMEISEKALSADYLINLPVLKGHGQTLVTCALKNMKGCIPDSEKRSFHVKGLHQPIAALSAVLKPDLILVDNICGDLNFEEGGNPVKTNRMFLGTDPVAVDAFGCRLMGIDPKDVPYIPLAARCGSGTMALKEEDIIYLNKGEAAGPAMKPSGIVQRLTRNVLQKDACSACFGNLVHALNRLYEDGTPYQGRISIGQGFKGQKADGIGIGVCCAGAKTCVMGCPADAERILEALKN